MRYQTSRQMRKVAAEIGRNMADMQHTQFVIGYNGGANDNWGDPMINAIQADIDKAQLRRVNLIARANGFDYAA